VKVHVHVDRRGAGRLRRQMDVFDLLTFVVEVIAVDVEEGVERDVEALAGENLRLRDAVLPVDDDLDAGPGFVCPVTDAEAAGLKLKWIGVLRRPASERRAQARKPDRHREESSTHGL